MVKKDNKALDEALEKNMGLSNKQQAFVNEYCSNGLNATQAYKTAYPNCKGGWDKLGPRLMGKDGIKQVVAVVLAEKQVKTEHNQQITLNNLQAAYDLAKKQGNPVAMVAAEREKNAVTGQHSYTIHTDAEQTKELTEAEAKAADEIAAIANRQSIRIHREDAPGSA